MFTNTEKSLIDKKYFKIISEMEEIYCDNK